MRDVGNMKYFFSAWRAAAPLRFSTLLVLSMVCLSVSVYGQRSEQARSLRYLETGEYSVALRFANQSPPGQSRDQALAQIASHQSAHGARPSSFQTAASIESDPYRGQVLSQLYQQSSSTSFPQTESTPVVPGGGIQGGPAGGITAGDFDEVIGLIESTINPDSWDTNGGTGRLSPFPSGVFVDSQGTLKNVGVVSSATLDQRLRDMSKVPVDSELVVEIPLRRISLTRLEKNLELLTAQGKPIPNSLFHLAGIYELKYLIFYPESKDIVLAGPAGKWHVDHKGRAIHSASGKPVLRLDDLVVCLRNAWYGGGQFGCSIDPRAENLKALTDLLSQAPGGGDGWAEELRDTVGFQDVTIDGIAPMSHAARVIVEADYHMKLVGMGIEPSIDKVKSFMDRLKMDAAGNPPSLDLVRWWFTMDYDAVRANQSRTVFEIRGPGVKLLSEKEFLDASGQRIHTGESTRHASGFARDFSTHFDEMATRHLVFAEMKNVFDLALAANLIRDQNAAQQIGWIPSLFADASPGRSLVTRGVTYQIPHEPVPVQVNTVMGSRQLKYQKDGRRFTTTIYSVSGGVECYPLDVVQDDKIQVTDAEEWKLPEMAAPPELSAWSQFWWD